MERELASIGEVLGTLVFVLGCLGFMWIVWKAHEETKGTPRSDPEQEVLKDNPEIKLLLRQLKKTLRECEMELDRQGIPREVKH